MRVFKPREMLDSFSDIDIQKLKEKGIEGLVSDIDNTLVPHDYPHAPEMVSDFFKKLEAAGIKACLVSNNHKERIEPFNAVLNLPYVADAGKPGLKGYRKAMRILKTKPETTAVLGDQLFTDMWGANMAGMYTILVKPVDLHSEDFLIKLKRIMERIIMKFWK